MENENLIENIKVELKEIMDLIPHRYPFLLIDKAENFVKNESIVGERQLSRKRLYVYGAL
jgi:3-hydroxyacyl-[acyl-carrier-protein] dehydratase